MIFQFSWKVNSEMKEEHSSLEEAPNWSGRAIEMGVGVLGNHWLTACLAWPGTIVTTYMTCLKHEVLVRNAKLTRYHQPEEFGKGQKERERAMAPHSNPLAWTVLWTEEPGGLLSMGSHRVGHDWSDLAAAAAAKGERRLQPICPTNFPESFSLESILAECCARHQEGPWVRVSGPRQRETSPTRKPEAAAGAEPFSWVPPPWCSPPGRPFPIKSLALSAQVSPHTLHFWVWDKSPLAGLKGSPFLQQQCEDGNGRHSVSVCLALKGRWELLRGDRRGERTGCLEAVCQRDTSTGTFRKRPC